MREKPVHTFTASRPRTFPSIKTSWPLANLPGNVYYNMGLPGNAYWHCARDLRPRARATGKNFTCKRLKLGLTLLPTRDDFELVLTEDCSPLGSRSPDCASCPSNSGPRPRRAQRARPPCVA